MFATLLLDLLGAKLLTFGAVNAPQYVMHWREVECQPVLEQEIFWAIALESEDRVHVQSERCCLPLDPVDCDRTDFSCWK